MANRTFGRLRNGPRTSRPRQKRADAGKPDFREISWQEALAFVRFNPRGTQNTGTQRSSEVRPCGPAPIRAPTVFVDEPDATLVRGPAMSPPTITPPPTRPVDRSARASYHVEEWWAGVSRPRPQGACQGPKVACLAVPDRQLGKPTVAPRRLWGVCLHARQAGPFCATGRARLTPPGERLAAARSGAGSRRPGIRGGCSSVG